MTPDTQRWEQTHHGDTATGHCSPTALEAGPPEGHSSVCVKLAHSQVQALEPDSGLRAGSVSVRSKGPAHAWFVPVQAPAEGFL